jgi:hypothetical protein
MAVEVFVALEVGRRSTAAGVARAVQGSMTAGGARCHRARMEEHGDL